MGDAICEFCHSVAGKRDIRSNFWRGYEHQRVGIVCVDAGSHVLVASRKYACNWPESSAWITLSFFLCADVQFDMMKTRLQNMKADPVTGQMVTMPLSVFRVSCACATCERPGHAQWIGPWLIADRRCVFVQPYRNIGHCAYEVRVASFRLRAIPPARLSLGHLAAN